MSQCCNQVDRCMERWVAACGGVVVASSLDLASAATTSTHSWQERPNHTCVHARKRHSRLGRAVACGTMRAVGAPTWRGRSIHRQKTTQDERALSSVFWVATRWLIDDEVPIEWCYPHACGGSSSHPRGRLLYVLSHNYRPASRGRGSHGNRTDSPGACAPAK